MRATLVHASVDPERIPETARAVEAELVPGFLGHPGSRHSYWMAHRRSGRLLVLTVWDTQDHMDAAAASEAARRAIVGERCGVRIMGAHTMEVVGAHEEPIDRAPNVRWVRTTWVSGLGLLQRGGLPALYREAVPDQLRTRGFCASYWLVDSAVGAALGLSFWEGPTEIRDSARSGAHRRRRFEAVLGCTVEGVREYEAIGVASVVTDGPSPALSDRPVPTTGAAALERIGTPLDRPPGALLAVSGEQTDQVVVVLDGQVALIDRADLCRLAPGEHFGGRRILDRRTHAHTVMATSAVRLGVISRSEFTDLADSTPAVARELVEHDADP
ncbi:MAG: cyclic nucleotide-binding domain-containing protein [Microthrixaceae bacterium]